MLGLPGRLIGFGVSTAQFTRGDAEQIVRIAAVYNSCNCPASSFATDNPPIPMLITAVEDTEVTQTLAYRNNVIEQAYGQDCGEQTVSIISQVSPSPLDVTIQ